MRIKRHGCLLFLAAVVSVPAAAVYWWSWPLIPFCLEVAGSPSGREAVVRRAVAFPLLRRESVVEEATHLHNQRMGSNLVQIITRRYSEAALMDELADLWSRKLHAQEYFRAGVVLAFAHDLYGEKFRPRVRRKDVEALIAGLGPGLEHYLRWHWDRGLMMRRIEKERESPSAANGVILSEGTADLLAYPES